MHKITKINILLAVFLLAFSPAFAANEDTLANQAIKEVSTQSEQFRKEAQKEIHQLPATKPEIVDKRNQEGPNLEAAGPTFFISKINIEENTVFSYEELSVYLKDFENRTLSFNDLRAAAQLITFHYRSNGYTTSRAYLPPQKIQNQTATIKVLEGRISKILVEDNKVFSKESYINAIHLKSDEIFRYQNLELNLYELNEKPDRRVKAYLQPSDEPTKSDIILKVTESNPLHPFVEFNNHGTKLTHRARYNTGFTHNNFLGHSDTLRTFLSYAEQQAVEAGSVSYTFPFEKTGTTLSFSASYSKSALAKHLRPFDVDGTSLSVSPSITQNFIRTSRFKLTGSLSLDIEDSKTTIADERSNYDRMRSLVFGPQMTFWDSMGKTIVQMAMHVGLPDFLGGLKSVDPKASRSNTGGEFTTFTGQVARIQRLPWPSTYLIAKVGGQWTDDSLTSLEQFRAGGAYTVRGYPESDAQGDYGYNFSTEFNTQVPFIPADWKVPFSKKSWKEAVWLVTFIEGAKTYLNERDAPTTVKDRFLLGTGAGVRLYVNDAISVQADFGFPIGDDSSDKNNMQTHLLMRAEW